MTQVWAHRGARLEAPENTLAAFAAAIDAGADGIELDVRRTADGVLVIHHDPRVALGDGSVHALRDVTVADLATVRLGDGERVPTLAEAYAMLAPTALTLNVELKRVALPDRGLEEQSLAAMHASGMADRVVHSSFDHGALLRIRRLDPDARIAPLYERPRPHPWELATRLGAEAVHAYAPTLASPGILVGLADSGIGVRAWTVNDPHEQRELIAAGIDALITDDPRRAVALRDSLAGS
ncbi:glycerophosphodiester phosphodiesterase [Demequina lignilytica]|uniref:Glycerophosphodiester phosphodiesterase family protein n=1 Tax=Demequina lignilytica TaxID=3051663 RepID=A0AB35MIT9_9MICO|nr:glycerophosphodiester phosphodiesterase family protein [Demequina sp. SYSU T0a273]MDN4483710.1 glycerophosphodiester phosphodiesterase family protein [Demequina sp. SYSU T0a273]